MFMDSELLGLPGLLGSLEGVFGLGSTCSDTLDAQERSVDLSNLVANVKKNGLGGPGHFHEFHKA